MAEGEDGAPEELALGGMAVEASLAEAGEDKVEGGEVFLVGLGENDDII